MKRILSCILTAAILVGMLAIGGVSAAEGDVALKFNDTPLTEGGGSHGNASFRDESVLDGNGLTVRMDFTYGNSAPCIHPKEPTLYHSSKLAFMIGQCEGTYKYFGYSATKDAFFFAVSPNPPVSGETTNGFEYLALSETGLVQPGVTYDLVFELVGSDAYDAGEAYINIYLDGKVVLSFDLYKDMAYPTYFPYNGLTMYPTHINCYIDNLAVYTAGVYNPATGEGEDQYVDFTDFSDAETKTSESTDEDGNVTVNTYLNTSNWGFNAEAYSIVTVSDEIYGQPQYIPEEGQVNVVFQNDVESTSGRDFTVDLTVVNNPGINSLKLDLLSDPNITVKGVEAAEGLTAELDGTKLTITGNVYTGETLATITYTMSSESVQDFFYGYGASVYTMEITGNEGVENAVLTNGLTKVYNYTVGDMNDDGKFNLADVTLILKVSAKWNLPNVFVEAGDVDGDGRTNTRDAAYYIRWIARWKGYMINGIAY